jgi:predicted AAA+ superfamily ATPase
MKLYPRYIEPAVKVALADTPVVCVLGPRQAGKTTLVQRLEPKRDYISFDDQNLLNAASNDPLGFVQSLPKNVTLDEVQRVPDLLPAIKLSVDQQRTPGQFLLTGSANLLLLPRVQESLAGRIEVIHLHPLSELEKHGGEKSLLKAFLNGEIKTRISSNAGVVQGVPEAICQGGYPEPNTRSETGARRWFRQYLSAIIQRDVRDIASIHKEDELVRLMELLALRTGNLLNVNNASKDLGLDRETTEKYITILERLFLVHRLPAWHRNRARRLIRTSKIHVVDSGLATMLNRLNIGDWASHSTDFSAVLESFVVQQLICQAGWLDDDLVFTHYRDKEKIEVDLVIEQGRNVWGIEVKRTASLNKKDGAGLRKLAAQAGSQFKGGILLYSGTSCLPIGVENCFAVPLDMLW